MKKIGFYLCIMLLLGIASSAAFAGVVTSEYAFNVDGTVYDVPYGTPPPAFISLGSFPSLGTISLTVSGEGDHFVLGFFDFDLYQQEEFFADELGIAVGTPASGQSYEIGDPFGDIYTNFSNNTLLNSTNPEYWDVSMSMGWNFNLKENQTAQISFRVSETEPNSFHLVQMDGQTDEKVYLSNELKITTKPPTGVPEPGMFVLLILGAGATMAATLRKRG